MKQLILFFLERAAWYSDLHCYLVLWRSGMFWIFLLIFLLSLLQLTELRSEWEMEDEVLRLYPECTNLECTNPDHVDFPNAILDSQPLPKGVSQIVRPKGLGTIEAKCGKSGHWHSGNRRFRIAVFQETCIQDKDVVSKMMNRKLSSTQSDLKKLTSWLKSMQEKQKSRLKILLMWKFKMMSVLLKL